MNESTGMRQKNLRATWVIGICVVLIVAAAMVWFALWGQDDDGNSADGSSPSESSVGVSSDSMELNKYCKEKVNGSPNIEVVVRDKKLTVSPKSVEFEFYLKHSSSKYVAVDVAFSIEFFKGDEDVTSDLGKDVVEDWRDRSATVLPNAASEFWDDDIPTPTGWTKNGIELRVKVDRVGYWCVPKEKYVDG